MAGRPPKEGIDYAGWDVNIFDDDTKIDKLMDSQGCVGFTIYFYLCQRAYGSNGYFFPWSFDDSATTSRKIGGGAGSVTVTQTVRLCFQIGLFDKRLFEEYGILTSRGIQKRYRQVAVTRTNRSVIKEYWLLKKNESTGLDFYALKSNYDTPKLNYDPSKFDRRKGKDSKGKDRILKDRRLYAKRVQRNKSGRYRCQSSSEIILNLYNEICPSLPSVDKIGAKVKGLIKEGIKKGCNINNYREVFSEVDKSKFLSGHSDTSKFRASLVWLVEPEHMSNVLAGQYRDWKPEDEDNQPNQRETNSFDINDFFEAAVRRSYSTDS